jgi:pSer/pThr/pTyr-binding forkhead associated (FHA) protein
MAIQGYLQIIAGPRSGLTIPIHDDRPLTIGRKRGELLLDDALVSGRHCQVRFVDGAFVVQDLGSTNGTLVGTQLVRESKLEPGDELTVGGSRMVLFITDEEVPGPAATDSGVSARHLDIAWLLDEELVELRGSGERTRTTADVISQDLRLPPGLNAVVEVVAGQDVGKVYRFTRGNVTVGRRQGEVPLSDVEVSRRHAVVEVFGRDMIFLRDLGSTNGTYHNGRRISVSKLQSGDTIGVGKTVMRLQLTR